MEFALGRPARHHELSKFARYQELLADWQRIHRLVGSTDPEWLVDNLMLDSLLFLRVLGKPDSPLLDLGSGAGVPGIPIKVVCEDLELTLLESKARRASFLRTVVRELDLTHVTVINDRAEHALSSHRGRFAAAVLRCAGRLDRIVPLALEFVRARGMVVASGGPRQQALDGASWTTVPGAAPGTTRSFVVALRS